MATPHPLDGADDGKISPQWEILHLACLLPGGWKGWKGILIWVAWFLV
jgi:hypothetical protein